MANATDTIAGIHAPEGLRGSAREFVTSTRKLLKTIDELVEAVRNHRRERSKELFYDITNLRAATNAAAGEIGARECILPV